VDKAETELRSPLSRRNPTVV